MSSVPVLVKSAQPSPLSFQIAPVKRLAAIVMLVVVEVIAGSVWLDTAALTGRGSVTEAIGDWGPAILQTSVVFAASWLAFAYVRHRRFLQTITHQIANHPVDLRALGAHVAALVLFSGLSAVLFGRELPGTAANLLCVAWIVCGAATVIFAALAAAPLSLWWLTIQSTISVTAWSLLAALAVIFGFSKVNRLLWSAGADVTFSYVAAILRPILPSITTDAAARILRTNQFEILITTQCSGIEGVTLIGVLTTGWLWWLRREWRFPHALVLLPAGMAVMWLLNGIRVALLFLIGNAGAPAVAIGGFHSQAGWIIFNTVAVGLFLSARRIQWFLAKDLSFTRNVGSPQNPATPYLLPFIVLVTTAMICGAASAGTFDYLYPLRLPVAAAVLLMFRRTYTKLDWRFGWLAPLAGCIVFALWMALAPAGLDRSGQELRATVQQLPTAAMMVWIAARVLASTITVPIIEELAFRGFLIRRLIRSDFETLPPRRYTWLSVAASTVAFGALHGGEWWFPAILAGAVYAAVYLYRGRIGDAVVAHATTNALIAAVVLLRGQWGFW